MKKIIYLFLVASMFTANTIAQNSFSAIITDHDHTPLIGANAIVEGSEIGGTSDENGIIKIDNIPDGTYHIHISYVGFEEKEQEFTFPLSSNTPLKIVLSAGEHMETVIVSTTRSSRHIEDIPTRIEAISGEELGEKAVMNSTNISVLLRESTGIQMQQTSASSANQSLRIQGLDGRYTQILKDGFPLFGGFAGGLSIMQIPPLDLKQVQIVKGSSSTLYGGGAIAGLVNLITKTPEENPELTFMYSQTNALGSTLNGYYSQQFGKVGMTLYSSGHYHKVYDNNDDDFSDLPRTKSISINPSFFYNFNEKSNLRLSLNSIFEDRWGGDVSLIKEGNPIGDHQYSELNLSKRLASQFRYENEIAPNTFLIIRNSVSYFDRKIELPDFTFEGGQLSSFSEATINLSDEKSDWVVGLNTWTDKFDEQNVELQRDYSNETYGVFGQNILSLSDMITLESGLRLDYNSDYEWFFLPRVNTLFNVNHHWSLRVGGGLGYKTPTMFTEEAEALAYQNILPIVTEDLEAEKSLGGNFDINYKNIYFNKISFSINNLFFYTRLNDPLILLLDADDNYYFENANGFVHSKGWESNVKFGYKDFKLFFNYAYIDADLDYNDVKRQKPLTPKHNIGTVLMYETEKWRVGLEYYFKGGQTLTNETSVRDYSIMGLMILRNIGNTDFYINFENFTDTRQSRYETVVQNHSDPVFNEIWAPTDGFIFTIGAKYHVFGKEEHGHH